MGTGFGLAYYYVYDPGVDEEGNAPPDLPPPQVVAEAKDAASLFVMEVGKNAFIREKGKLVDRPAGGSFGLLRLDIGIEYYGQEKFLAMLRQWLSWKGGPGQRLLRGLERGL